ncbi:hypothetical protein [Paracraurococcus ruber]|uniref:Uncharacterized protein n=1 Tax=Paracraurococcus ruber TaxID=77675 RepID=A0ABS1CSK8_9PROT|nr:hypothetical protein [Paracraurococcus ruber]MBK1657446.1 hypothetical protein [Paracraurococcus ruber]TDG32990.1 hypothetical protein E2C05_05505 [Paracraurococcus ruber]
MAAIADLLRAIAALVAALAWPATAALALCLFRPQIGRLIDRVSRVKLPGIEAEAEVRQQIEQSAEEARTRPIREPTHAELARAQRVDDLARSVPAGFLRQEVERLAAEYERVRGSMPGGAARTRAMEVVVAKMRTIGRAAWPLRNELVQSASPGRRLHAIAILQVEPDYDLLEWLAERPAVETPFVTYHAMVALDAAAADSRAAVHAPGLGRALAQAEASLAGLPEDADRRQVLARLADRLARLRPD